MQSKSSRKTKVFVASSNPVKIKAVEEAFGKFFPHMQVDGISVPSGVSDQPFNRETFTGAKNRVLNLKRLLLKQNLDYDYLVGIEGGVIDICSTTFALGIVYIQDKDGREAWGTSPAFQLPQKILDELRQGKELGEVMDRITGIHNSKKKIGAVGYFTKGNLLRSDFYRMGVYMALIPLINKELYFDAKN